MPLLCVLHGCDALVLVLPAALDLQGRQLAQTSVQAELLGLAQGLQQVLGMEPVLELEPVLVLELQLVLVLEPAQRRLAAAEQQVWKPGS